MSCPSATACTAVGQYQTKSGTFTLAERWKGARWSVQPTPDPGGGANFDLDSVSCASVTACTAAGSYEIHSSDRILAEAWNGNSWVIQPTPPLSAVGPEAPALYAVACPSTTACTVVGTYNQLTLAEHHAA